MALPMQLQSNQGLSPSQILGQSQSGFLSGLQDFLLGEPSRIQQFTNYTPEQQQYLNTIASSGLQNLMNPYSGFEPIAQKATSRFQQQTVPGLAERFTSLGANAPTSPIFASQLGQAGAGLSEGLAALQSQYGMQNRSQALSQLALGLQPQYQSIQSPGSSGLLGGLLQGSGQGGGLQILLKLLPLLLA